MRRRSGIVIAVSAVAAASAYATPAASTRPRAGSRVFDSTYSCRVRAQRYVDLAASVTLKLESGQEPAQARVTTVPKTIERNGLNYNVPQILFQAVKNSLAVDRANCRRSSRKVALRAAGLPHYQTVTRTVGGEVQVRCSAAKRVLVHLRIEMQNGTPQQALIAVRNTDLKRRKLAFFNWKPRKIASYVANRCVSLSG
jgi:hypothetical protein